MITQSLSDFFHDILAPYLDQKFGENDKDHADMKKTLIEHKALLEDNDKDHEKIFRAIERNREEHDEMFEKLDEIENHVKDHSKRIKKLESITAS